MSELPAERPLRVLFVCSGNICRSPLAEALFSSLAAARGVGHLFEVDSAGTHGFHEGDPADARARRVGERHGVRVTSISRPVNAGDFERFGLIVGMDRGHLRDLRRSCPAPRRDRIRLMRDFDQRDSDPDVPDPYYGGADGFERVYELLQHCCGNLLDALLEPRALTKPTTAAPDSRP